MQKLSHDSEEAKFGILVLGVLTLVSVVSAFGAVVDEPDEWWIYLEGPEVDEEQMREYPYFMEARTEYSSACVYNGSLYRQGYMKDVGRRIGFGGNTVLFESGGWYGDKEICLDTGQGDYDASGGIRSSDDYLGSDWGGEWHDVDQNRVTEYLRDNGGSLPSDEWQKYWIDDSRGLETSADPSTWDSDFTHDPGFAVEDDCLSESGGCEDIRDGTGYDDPFWANYTEGAGEDDNRFVGHVTNPLPNRGLDNFHNRVQAGDMDEDNNYTGHEEGNSQDNEPTSLSLAWDENSHIDPEDDEWALTPDLTYAIAHNGTPYASGQCYGAPRVQGVTKTKDQAVYANSYALGTRDTYKGGESSGRRDGTWINPDDNQRSITQGGYTCDITGDDWGFGFGNSTYDDLICRDPGSPECSVEGEPTSPGDEAFEPTRPHAISGEFTFDSRNDPAGYPQDNLEQYPNACGDDINEYLIREHSASIGGEENPEFEGRNNYYACADRKYDCVLQGEVYSPGQLVDVSGVRGDTGENGVNSYDHEICADLDPNIPGGEWYDPDNETMRDFLIGSGDAQNPEWYVRKGTPEQDNPGKVFWHEGNQNPPNGAHEAMISPYNPVDYETGYALEDDCDPVLAVDFDSGCDDSGHAETLGTDSNWQIDPGSDLIYSPFAEGMQEDDGNIFSGFTIRMWVGDGTGNGGSTAHGATNGQDQENVPEGVFTDDRIGGGTWPTEGLNDSIIDQLEDTWALSNFSYHAVGPTGHVWENGSCYGRMANQSSNNWITKDEKVVGNSFANDVDVDSDPEREGVWVDPDTTPKTTLSGGLSCDLNLTDWGIGYNTGRNELIVTHNDSVTEYSSDDYHVATGNITFDINSDPNGIGGSRNLPQYPNACGDDRNEFLIREHLDSVGDTEQIPSFDHTGYYVCADRISDCAYHGNVYSEGQLVDVSDYAQDEEAGVNSVDEEVCVDADKSVPGGEWYDVDNESLNQLLKGDNYDEDDPSTYSGLVRSNLSYDGNGVKWFTGDYEPAREAEISPYHDLDYSDGYALEDDCAENVEYCADEGATEQHFTPDAVYSYFEEGRREDDSNVFDGRSVQMYVGYANGTASSDHGATNDQDEENTDGTSFNSVEFGHPTPGLNDSTIDELEDTWAISANLSDPVGPTGKVWKAGSCYGKNPWLNEDIQWIDKSHKVVANSYAMAVDVNGYPLDEDKGVLVNPDSTNLSAKQGHTFCDLNASDWGYGYNTGDGDSLQMINGSGNQPGDIRENGYVEDNAHVVAGDINSIKTPILWVRGQMRTCLSILMPVETIRTNI